MKMNKFNIIAANVVDDSGIIASNEALAAANFTVASEGGLIVPFGDFPQVVLLKGVQLKKAQQAGMKVGADGRAVVIQRMDADAANAMRDELQSLWGSVKRFFAGAPVYEGHPFHPDSEQRKNYPNKRALGWIKEIEVLDDAMRLVPSYNSLGTEAVNDAQLAYHSPEWNMEFVGVESGVGVYRPVKLRSTGLTNEPNIPVPALVAANEGQVSSEPFQGSRADEVTPEFIEAARAALVKAEAESFEPLATALNELLAGDEAGMMERMQALRDRLPELAQEVAANEEAVAVWEEILGAAAGNGLAAAQQGQVSSDQDSSDEPNNEQDNAMLKKLIEALVAAGLIKADDPEEAVLVRLGGLKQEMDWKREEMERQKMEAARILAALPAANVAELGDAGEDVPLLSAELVTAASNTITTLREERDALAARLDETRVALVETTLNELTVANAITGADIEGARATLMAANDQAGFAEAVQELRKPGATVPATRRLSADLEGGREKVSAANEIGAQAEERRALVMKHQDRLSKGGKNKQAVYDAAWAAARAERPDLF